MSAWIYPPLIDAPLEEKPSSVLILFSFLDGITGLYCFWFPSWATARFGFNDFFAGTSVDTSVTVGDGGATSIVAVLSAVVRVLGKLTLLRLLRYLLRKLCHPLLLIRALTRLLVL